MHVTAMPLQIGAASPASGHWRMVQFTASHCLQFLSLECVNRNECVMAAGALYRKELPSQARYLQQCADSLHEQAAAKRLPDISRVTRSLPEARLCAFREVFAIYRV